MLNQWYLSHPDSDSADFFFWIGYFLTRNQNIFFPKIFTKTLRPDLQTLRPKISYKTKWEKENSCCFAQESALWRSQHVHEDFLIFLQNFEIEICIKPSFPWSPKLDSIPLIWVLGGGPKDLKKMQCQKENERTHSK